MATTISRKLDELEAARVVFYIRNGRLFVEGLARCGDSDLPGWIKHNKAQIMEEVKARDHERSQGARLRERRNMPGRCPCCGENDWWENNIGGWICQTCHPRNGKDGFNI
ncbi:MAG: hypothetical protein PHO79_02145 [Desulfoplanes sp.]|nr:hypothetical protein [Desulfoplanes sp.]